MFFKLLENQDHFSFKFQFVFLGKKRSHTTIGIIFSLLLNFGCLTMGILYIVELFKHSKPNVNYSKIRKSLTTNMTLNTPELLYSVGFRDKNYQIITDPAIGKIVPIYERMRSNGEGLLTQEQIELDIINCTNLFGEFKKVGLEEQFNSNGVKDYFCFNGTTLGEEVILGGKYGSEFYGNLRIEFKKCIDSQENKDKGIICKPENEINEALQDGWVQITYASAFIDSDNYSYPIQYILDGYYTRTDYSVNKMIYTYFNLVNFYSENNIIFNNEKLYVAIKEDYETTDLNLKNDDGSIFTAYVCPSFTIENYKRTYIKIQEIGANVAGFHRVCFMILYALISYYQSQYFDLKILNCLIRLNPNIIKNMTHDKPRSEKFQIIQMRSPHKNEMNVKDISFCELIKINFCIWSKHGQQKKRELDYLLKKKLMYTDYSEVVKLMYAIENIDSKGVLRSKKDSFFDNTSKDFLNASEKFIKQLTSSSHKELNQTREIRNNYLVKSDSKKIP